ncbi:MAG: Hsp20/alpha crystallin family protein [Chloroflexi bacterium]|nr:Hsp20/alpha crystallin family protein [Chloroflexota bacterium]
MSGYLNPSSDLPQHGIDWLHPRNKRRWHPPTDVYETDDAIVIKVEVAGMTTEDFSIIYADRVLTISGCRRDITDKIIYQNMEIPYGEFRTEVRVNWPLEERDIEALYENGFLYVRLPKGARERRIPIKQNSD